jgi:hypothetical protein
MSTAENQVNVLKNEPEEQPCFSEKNKLNALINEALDGTDDQAALLELTAAVQVLAACEYISTMQGARTNLIAFSPSMPCAFCPTCRRCWTDVQPRYRPCASGKTE